mgnify:CR=1 FL=1
MKKQNIIILVISILSIAWLLNSIFTVLMLFTVIGIGYKYALQYKHLWKDAGELFKDLKKRKKSDSIRHFIFCKS